MDDKAIAVVRGRQQRHGDMKIRARCYSMCGLILVGLGAAGIFVPLLPTTPFLLLAAYLFARSDRRLHDWLLHHKHLGPYIHAFRNKSGLTSRQKVRIGISLTFVLGISFYLAPVLAVRYLLVALWIFWGVMLIGMKTRDSESAATDASSGNCVS